MLYTFIVTFIVIPLGKVSPPSPARGRRLRSHPLVSGTVSEGTAPGAGPLGGPWGGSTGVGPRGESTGTYTGQGPWGESTGGVHKGGRGPWGGFHKAGSIGVSPQGRVHRVGGVRP